MLNGPTRPPKRPGKSSTPQEDLSSERTAARARAVLHRLMEYEHVPEAREVLTDYGHLLLA
ncbi:hypothetical protein ACFZC3_06715 [Streptomyces sp. NPDC007903]|uniref:hypothetical protein n=1 Tax=Streptomyces sp. NPDC007903 TaxID=3364786 RepID=UPI0036E8B795